MKATDGKYGGSIHGEPAALAKSDALTTPVITVVHCAGSFSAAFVERSGK
jgi:hypothetical protein